MRFGGFTTAGASSFAFAGSSYSWSWSGQNPTSWAVYNQVGGSIARIGLTAGANRSVLIAVTHFGLQFVLGVDSFGNAQTGVSNVVTR